jgi:hypothetical protein
LLPQRLPRKLYGCVHENFMSTVVFCRDQVMYGKRVTDQFIGKLTSPTIILFQSLTLRFRQTAVTKWISNSRLNRKGLEDLEGRTFMGKHIALASSA